MSPHPLEGALGGSVAGFPPALVEPGLAIAFAPFTHPTETKRIASVQLDNGIRRTLDRIRGIAKSRHHNGLRPTILLWRGSLWTRALAGTAYCIAAVHIDEVHRGPRSEAAEHEPCGGIAPADTFHPRTLRDGFLKRQDLPVQVGSRPFKLRGNQRTQGEYSRHDGQIAFGQGSWALHAQDYRERFGNDPKGGP